MPGNHHSYGTVAAAMARPIRAGATMGSLAGQGSYRGAPVGGYAPFEPQLALPEQLLERRSLTELMPERRLMLAVLEDAIAICGRHLTSDTDVARDQARAWVASDEREYPFSYRPICEALGLSADAIRREVLAPGFTLHRPRRANNLVGERHRRVVGA